MGRCRRFSMVLIASLAVAAMGTGAASAAVTATVAPSPSAITATGANGVLWLNQTARKSYSCTANAFTVRIATAAGGLPLTLGTNLNWTFTGCRIVGGAGLVATCAAAENFAVTGVTSGNSTFGTVGVDCVMTLQAMPTCNVRILGTVPILYNNNGTNTSVVTGQTLEASRTTCAAVLPNDSFVRVVDTTTMSNFSQTVAPATTINVV